MTGFQFLTLCSRDTIFGVNRAPTSTKRPTAFSRRQATKVPSPTPILSIQQREQDYYELALQIQLQCMAEEPEVVMRECIVCGDRACLADLPILTGCTHETRTCSSCYEGWISSQLEEQGWKRIKCPEAKCEQILEHADVQCYSSVEVFQR